MQKGIIASIQGYHQKTIEELALNAINGGAVAIRTDKPIRVNVPLIGLNKIHVNWPEKEAYITPSIELIEKVAEWAQYVAIDYRSLNHDLEQISDYCLENKIKVVADIGTYQDYLNIKERGFYFTFLTTTFSVHHVRFNPDLRLLKKLLKEEKNVIGEGNYYTRPQVDEAFKIGAHNVCIGGAISDVYKLTRKFATVLIK